MESHQQGGGRNEGGGANSSSRGKAPNDDSPVTAHQISTDSWFQVGFILTSGVNSAYVLGYSGTIMVPLGWNGGVVGLIMSTIMSLYASSLVANLHMLGGQRHIRYRDLAGYVYGKKAYSLTWGLQYVNLFMINAGYIILAGQAIKAACVLFWENDAIKLPYCICIAGFVCALFAILIPHLSALGIWLAVSTILSLIYIVVSIVLSLNDGIHAAPRDYSITGNFFQIMGATANLVFAFNTGMLPEIQATIRQPVVSNMMKALVFQFTAGVLPLYAVCFTGYWAYGSSTSSYLLSSASGPTWVKASANIAAFLQSVIAFHIFASPMYEFLDTKYGIEGSSLLLRNLSFRVGVRGGYLAFSTFVSALFPFLGDFMSLTGAISTFPLTFILANHMYMMAKKRELSCLQKAWHWFNVGLFSCLAVGALIAALRFVSVDSTTYHFFADL